MQSLTNHRILEWPPNAIFEIRKIHNLHTPGRINEAVTILEEWIQKQDHFLKKDFSKEYLERCIINNKGSIEKTKKQIDGLCTMKTLLPQFFTMHNPKQDIKELFNYGDFLMLPKMTNDFCRLFLINIRTKKISERAIMEYILYCIPAVEYIKANDYSNSYASIYDFREISMKNLLAKINPVTLQQFFTIYLEGFGMRVKGIHLITRSKAVDLLIKLIKQIVSPKIAERIFVYKTIEDLHQVIPKDLLPKDYGGQQRTIKELSKDWVEELSTDENIEYFKMSSQACTNERLRRTDKFNDKYMGTAGSFRKLNLD